jgi:hypothetical protein
VLKWEYCTVHCKSVYHMFCGIVNSLVFFIYLFHFFILRGGTKSLGTAATSGLLYKPQMIDEGDCGAVDGMKIGRGN